MTAKAIDSQLQPAILVIFGITGDLAKKYLLPALYHLIRSNSLPQDFKVVGVTRRDSNLDDVIQNLKEGLTAKGESYDQDVVTVLRAKLEMFHLDLTAIEGYKKLYDHINKIEDLHSVHMNRLYYLSIPPQVYGPVVRLLGEAGHNASCQHGAASSRLLVEKPFGFDLQSATNLIQEINIAYGDFQVYRIDHYLAKETVQNIVTFRFNNPLFEAVWSYETISHIMISATEKIDIEGRAAFYEQTGAVRDLIQSHLLQLLALVTMERPASMQSKDIHAAKLQLMNAILPLPLDHLDNQVVLGQYEGYLEDVSNPSSSTETFAAMQLSINNDRWKQTPMYLRTGKSMSKRATTITVVFKSLYEGEPSNKLTFHLQPDEGITLLLQAKKPGLANEVEEVPMEFKYSNSFKGEQPDAYERVLLDAIKGDKTLFSTSEEVLASWRIIQPILHATHQHIYRYNSGSDGPAQAAGLLKPPETRWS